MKYSEDLNKIRQLIKVSLNTSNIIKKLIASFIIFSVIIYFMASNLLKVSYSYNLNLNIWDGIFRITTYSTLILGFYIPYIIIITTFFNAKSDYLKFIMLKSKHKKNMVISRIATSFILSFLFTGSLFIIIFTINFFIFNFESKWSSVIVSKESIKLVAILYPNFFVNSFNPIQAFLISFIQILITTFIMLNIRDLFTNYIKSKNISYSVISVYLIINIIVDSYGLNEGIFKLNDYIGLGTISSIFKHKFEIYYGFNTTIATSIFISIIFLSILIIINLLFCRKVLIEND